MSVTWILAVKTGTHRSHSFAMLATCHMCLLRQMLSVMIVDLEAESTKCPALSFGTIQLLES
eukprot:2207239-Amphidinium_carterae.1